MATAKKTTKKTEAPAELDMARKIWLAGVGAYGRMYSETQGAVERLTSGAGETFEQLVARGEEVEEKVREAIAKSSSGKKYVEMVEEAAARAKTYSEERRAELEARIEKVRKTVTDALAPYAPTTLNASMEKLAAQVEALTAEVATLKAEKAAKPAKVDA